MLDSGSSDFANLAIASNGAGLDGHGCLTGDVYTTAVSLPSYSVIEAVAQRSATGIVGISIDAEVATGNGDGRSIGSCFVASQLVPTHDGCHSIEELTAADGKTYYGEEQSIKIDDPTGIIDAMAETPASGDVKVYTLTGALIYSGAEDKMHLEKGLYIIRQPDGKTQKVIIR